MNNSAGDSDESAIVTIFDDAAHRAFLTNSKLNSVIVVLDWKSPKNEDPNTIKGLWFAENREQKTGAKALTALGSFFQVGANLLDLADEYRKTLASTLTNLTKNLINNA